jgi:hypothetical protein
MGNSLEIANIFDEWEKTLTPMQRKWCRRALKNAAVLENVGQDSIKELIILVLLFCEEHLEISTGGKNA